MLKRVKAELRQGRCSFIAENTEYTTHLDCHRFDSSVAALWAEVSMMRGMAV
jgi:hypothetical protein